MTAPSPPPKDLVGYLQRFDNPNNGYHSTFGILHKTNSINDSEVKIFAGIDQIITPQHSEDSRDGTFIVQRANQTKRLPHITKDEWIAARFMSIDIGQSLQNEKLLPVHIVHVSSSLQRARRGVAAALTQRLFAAASYEVFSKNRLPSFIRDLWRLEGSNSEIYAASTNTMENILTFGKVSVSWTLYHGAEGRSLRRLIFYGSLSQSFKLVLDVADEEYKTLYAGEIVSDQLLVLCTAG